MYFKKKLQKRQAARDERRKLRKEEAERLDILTPDDSDDDIAIDSEEAMPEDDIVTLANEQLNEQLTSYVEAIAEKISDPDEQTRQCAIEALQLLQGVVEPTTGKQLLVLEDGRYRAKAVADCIDPSYQTGSAVAEQTETE